MTSSSEELTDEESEIVQVVSRQRVIDGSDLEDIDDPQDDDEIEDDDEVEPVVDAIADEQDSDGHNDDNNEQENAIENDEGEIIEAVVVQEDGEDPDSDGENTVEVSVVEEVQASSNTKNKRKPSSVSKSSKRVKASGHGSSNGRKKSSSKAEVVDSRNKRKGKKKKVYDPSDSKDKKTKKRDVAIAISKDPVAALYNRIPARVVDVAKDARTMLRETVPVLPFPIADTQIKFWGSLCVQVGNDEEGNVVIGNESSSVKYFNTNCALYPVGFTCDRYEFSPVHGRVLKMRCSILDGKSIKSRLRELARSKDANNITTNNIEANAASSLHDGPVFRVSWGPGVDDDPEKDAEHPYDPEIHSQPIFVNSKGKRRNDLLQTSKSIPPENGMRVKVRFNREQFCFGTIQSVNFSSGKDSSSKKNKTATSEDSLVSVRYDHGAVETFNYPDQDLIILLPGKLHISEYYRCSCRSSLIYP
jgi:hypothetical protein